MFKYHEVSEFEDYSIEQRIKAYDKIRERYPDRIPVILKKTKKNSLPDLIKTKYLVENDMTVGRFLIHLRKNINLNPEKAIFLFVGSGVLPPTSSNMKQIYDRYKSSDGFLYMTITTESTFG